MATIVAFHAHPDDEVLLTGGTLAKLADEGNRVIVVVATDGFMGGPGEPGARVRMDELRASAALLAVARVVHLGYADSGHGPLLYPDPPGRVRFARADIGEAARRLADVIAAERADVLLSYDARGGYGHRDHVMVHHVGARAAELDGNVRLLEATAPRAAAALLPLIFGTGQRIPAARGAPRITHRVNVRAYAGRKRAALAAHESQTGSADRASPLLRLLVRLPVPLFGLLLGREWFCEPAA